MNFEKLLAMLVTSSLYCCRIDQLLDPWEATWPRSIREAVRGQGLSEGLSDAGLGTSKFFTNLERLRACFFVSCWHDSLHESAALWEQYANSAGVAVRSTVGRLIRAGTTGPTFYIGKVQYLDYEVEAPTMGSFNLVVSAFLKRRSFEHEREVRLLVCDFPVAGHKLDPERATESVSVQVNLPVLVEAIYLSPRCPAWLVPLTKELLRRFELPCVPVRRSALYDHQVY